MGPQIDGLIWVVFQRKGTGVQCEAPEHYVPPSSSCHAAALHLQKLVFMENGKTN